MDLIADIGATSSRCALIDDEGQILAPEVFTNADFENLENLLDHYIERRRDSDRPSRAALAIAAPVASDYVEMTNFEWSFSRIAMQVHLAVRRLVVLNDYEALAWSLLDLDTTKLAQVGRGEAVKRATRAVIGPGTGLGVATLAPHPEGWTAISGEGGHASLAATTAEEARVIEILQARFDHCSAERILSGPGLVNLYNALCEISGRGASTIEPDDITALAAKREPLASQTLELFFSFLGTVASDLAVTNGTRGGLYIAGGIVPQVVDAIRRSGFRPRFESKGKYQQYLAQIPTYVITEPLPAFRGLRRVLGFSGTGTP